MIYVTEYLCKRLRDQEAKLRSLALTKLFEIASEDVTVLRVETVVEMGHRIKDKKSDIGTQTLVGMSKLYAKHLSSQLPGIDTLCPDSSSSTGDDLDNSAKRSDKDKKKKPVTTPAFDIRKVVRPEVLERCQFIPSLVINSWGYPDTPTRHLVSQVLQEFILPKVVRATKSGTDSQTGSQNQSQSQSQSQTEPGELPVIDSVRATALLLLYDVLSEADRNFLGSILGAKTKVRITALIIIMKENYI